jgi:hypothetical protein
VRVQVFRKAVVCCADEHVLIVAVAVAGLLPKMEFLRVTTAQRERSSGWKEFRGGGWLTVSSISSATATGTVIVTQSPPGERRIIPSPTMP